MNIIFFALIGILLTFGALYIHEQAHVEVYRLHGINSHVEYFSHLPSFVTIADSECKDSCISDQANVESIGYQILPIFLLIFFGFLFILSELSFSNQINEEHFKRTYGISTNR